MKILAIETSCDETCAAVTKGRRALSSVVSSQIEIHRAWGGVVPQLARRAHEERIGPVVAEALKKGLGLKGKEGWEEIIEEGMGQIEAVAVTYGPGLAIALGVGIDFAKKLSRKYDKKLVAVNHIEGHLLSAWVQDEKGQVEREPELPALALTVSGGHSSLVLVERIGKYELVGETLDDAAGEALDKAAKILGLPYPGGPEIEREARRGDKKYLELPRPMSHSPLLNYSFAGLKTAFYYKVREMEEQKKKERLADLAASFQTAVFDTLLKKYIKAIERFKPKSLIAVGGVLANQVLRERVEKLGKEKGLPVYLPQLRSLNMDNAAMIGVVAYYKVKRGEVVENLEELEREARAKL